MAAKLTGALKWLTICTFGTALLAFLAATAVQAYYDSMDRVTVVPMHRNNRVRFDAGRTGDYWITVVVRPCPPLEVETAAAIRFESIRVFDRSHDIPVRRIDSAGISDALDIRLAEVSLEGGHSYDFDIACSGFDTLPSNYSTQLKISASGKLNSTRNNLMMDSAIACVAFFCLGILCSIALLIAYMLSGPR